MLLVTVTAKDSASDEVKELVSTNGPQFKHEPESELFSSIRTSWFGSLPVGDLYIENVPGQVPPVPEYQKPTGGFHTA